MKFLIDFEAQRAQLVKTHKFAESLVKQKTNRSVIQISNPEQEKLKWIKKTLIIELLRSVAKKVGSPSVNKDMKDSLISTY